MRISDRDLLARSTAAIGFGLVSAAALYLAVPARIPLWVLLSLALSLAAIPSFVTWLAQRPESTSRPGYDVREAVAPALARVSGPRWPRDVAGMTVLLVGTLVLLRAYTELAEDPLARSDPVPGVVVEARHAHTGDPAAHRVLGVIRDGDYTETLKVVDEAARRREEARDRTAALLAGAYERPGVYRIRVWRPGFGEWRARGIVVERRDGRLITARLVAELEPTAGRPDPGSTKSADPLQESVRRPRVLRRRRPRART